MIVRAFGQLLACVLLAFASFPAIVYSQAATATLDGVVTDQTDAALPGVAMTIVHEDTSVSRAAVTGADGRFHVPALRPGAYTVTASLEGFAPVTRKGLTLTVGSTATLKLTLAMAGQADTVTVTGEAPLIDTASAEVGVTVTTTQIASLPLNSREFLDLANLGAAAKPDVFRPYNDVQVGAQSGRLTNVSVDGMDNNRELNGDPNVRYSLDAVQEFKIVTNGFLPEFGRASAGLVNVITKSGTNTFEALGFAYFRDRALNARNAFAAARPPFSRQQAGFTVGGPIVRGRAFFFANLEGHRLNTQAFVNTRGAFPEQERAIDQQQRNYLGSLKTDVRLTDDQTLTLRYSMHSTLSPNENAGGAVTEEAAYSRDGDEGAALASHTWVIGPRVVNEARYQFSRYSYNEGNNSNLVGVTRGGLLAIGNGGDCCNGAALEKYQEIRDDLSIDADGWGGNHRLKMGFNMKRIAHAGFDRAYAVGQYVFDTAAPFNPADPRTYPSQFRIGVGSGEVALVNTLLAAYVQDSFRVGQRLTLNYGVRYDLETNAINRGGAPGTNVLVDAARRTPDRNNVAPRVQFTYDLHGNGRSVLRGGYGRFYDQILSGLRTGELRNDGRTYNIATIADPALLRFFPDVNATLGGKSPADFLVGAVPDVSVIGNDIVTPYSTQLTAGYSQQLAEGLVASAEYVRTIGRSELLVVDRNPPDPVTFVRPNPTFRRIRTNESIGRSSYDGLFARLEKRFNGRYQMLGTYNLGRGSATADSPFSMVADPFDVEADYGPSSYVQRHRIAWSGVVVLPTGVQLGSILTWSSPLPFNITAGRDINRDLSLSDRPAGVRRNSGATAANLEAINAWRRADGLAPVTDADLRGANSFNWDLRVSRPFRAGHARIEALVEVFNLTNRVNYIRFVSNARLAALGQPTVAGDPRQMQLGLRVSF